MVYLKFRDKIVPCVIETIQSVGLVPYGTIAREVRDLYGAPITLSLKVLGYSMGDFNGFPLTKTKIDMCKLIRQVYIDSKEVKIGNRVKLNKFNGPVFRVYDIKGNLVQLSNTAWYPKDQVKFYAES